MRTVALVTDSSTCLPAALIETFGINVLPISAYLPDEHFPRAARRSPKRPNSKSCRPPIDPSSQST
jgi:fatty acid-binding protein DegV